MGRGAKKWGVTEEAREVRGSALAASTGLLRDGKHRLWPTPVEDPSTLCNPDAKHTEPAEKADRQSQVRHPRREKGPGHQCNRWQRQDHGGDHGQRKRKQRWQTTSVAARKGVNARRRRWPLPERPDQGSNAEAGKHEAKGE